MQVETREVFARPSWKGMYDEFNDVVSKLKGWDHAFENATGTYPTWEFASGFRSVVNRAAQAVQSADSMQVWIDGASGHDFENLSRSKLRPEIRALTSTWASGPITKLEQMAQKRTPFSSQAPQYSYGTPAWATLLDPLIEDLQVGARYILSAWVKQSPSTPATPNPGPGSGTGWIPGGPRPTPVP